MRTLIEQFRCAPTLENARRLRQYFDRHPSRLWVVNGDDLNLLAAAGVRGARF